MYNTQLLFKPVTPISVSFKHYHNYYR